MPSPHKALKAKNHPLLTTRSSKCWKNTGEATPQAMQVWNPSSPNHRVE
jgi:hypothetical protein